jgi:DNA (cytosine-5)-methyltransferase 1
LAHGVSKRVGKLRGAGNAIVPQLAALFIRAYLNARRTIHDEGLPST